MDRGEAHIQLKKIGKSSKTRYVEVGAYSTTTSGDVPAAASALCGAGAGTLHAGGAAGWAAAPWLDVEFSMESDHRYAYSWPTATATTGVR